MSNLKNKIDNSIIEFYLNVDINVIKDSLKEDGFDIDILDKKISQFSKRLKFNHKAIEAKEKSENLMDLIIGKFQDAIEKNIDKPIAALKRLIEEKELSVQFRNLEKLSEDEIKEIIKGKNLVDLLDELDDETN